MSKTQVIIAFHQIFVTSLPANMPISDSSESQYNKIPMRRVEFQAIFRNEINAQRSKSTGAKINRFHSPKSVERKSERYPPTTELESPKNPSTHKKMSTTAAMIFRLSLLMEALAAFLLFRPIAQKLNRVKYCFSWLYKNLGNCKLEGKTLDFFDFFHTVILFNFLLFTFCFNV